MSTSREHVVTVLRRAGLKEVAEEARQTPVRSSRRARAAAIRRRAQTDPGIADGTHGRQPLTNRAG
jgi:hypothetical protein